MDPRLTRLADVLVGHSTGVKAGEHVLIEAIDIPNDLVTALIQRIHAVNAHPHVWIKSNQLTRELLLGMSKDQIIVHGEAELAYMEAMNCYIGIRGGLNVNEMSDVPKDKLKLYQDHHLKPVHFQERVNNTRWVILRYPTPSFAQQASMSTSAFEQFFFDVCTMDYSAMDRAMQPLIDIMAQTDEVEIKGPTVDLRFSIKNIPVIGCAGTHNIPDGEVFTAPVRDSVNGYIAYNTPTIYQGVTFKDVKLTFKDGKVVEASADRSEKLQEILDTDEGARYVGEFAIGFNPYITEPMLDILFDEKIAGSFHFTPGQAYESADNGNRSKVHWDMVMRQTEALGGGDIWFDGVCIRRNGLFVPDALQGLNPEQLKR